MVNVVDCVKIHIYDISLNIKFGVASPENVYPEVICKLWYN